MELWAFTTLIRERYSVGQKMVLGEAMWGLALDRTSRKPSSCSLSLLQSVQLFPKPFLRRQ